jgi:hypothetical protein
MAIVTFTKAMHAAIMRASAKRSNCYVSRYGSLKDNADAEAKWMAICSKVDSWPAEAEL